MFKNSRHAKDNDFASYSKPHCAINYNHMCYWSCSDWQMVKFQFNRHQFVDLL